MAFPPIPNWLKDAANAALNNLKEAFEPRSWRPIFTGFTYTLHAVPKQDFGAFFREHRDFVVPSDLFEYACKCDLDKQARVMLNEAKQLLSDNPGCFICCTDISFF